MTPSGQLLWSGFFHPTHTLDLDFFFYSTIFLRPPSAISSCSAHVIRSQLLLLLPVVMSSDTNLPEIPRSSNPARTQAHTTMFFLPSLTNSGQGGHKTKEALLPGSNEKKIAFPTRKIPSPRLARALLHNPVYGPTATVTAAADFVEGGKILIAKSPFF